MRVALVGLQEEVSTFPIKSMGCATSTGKYGHRHPEVEIRQLRRRGFGRPYEPPVGADPERGAARRGVRYPRSENGEAAGGGKVSGVKLGGKATSPSEAPPER